MKQTILIVLLLSFALCFAGEFSGFYKDPDHPGKCFYAGLLLSPGEEAQPVGKCQRFMCIRSDSFGTVQGCGVQAVQSPCKLGDHVKPSGPYPDCCMRKVICP